MKKLVTLLAAAGMVVAASAPASAADVKLDGFYRYTFQRAATGFQGADKEEMMQRMRLGLTISASENLSGYTQFQIGTTHWGDSPKHGKTDVQTRQYYIDWKVPGAPVKVRMGRQQLGLPADAFGGNNVMGAAWGPRDGIVVNANAASWLNVSAIWARAAEGESHNGGIPASGAIDSDIADKNLDVFALAANMKFDGFSVAPWIAFATQSEGMDGHNGYSNSDTEGANDQYASDTYYVGGTATVTAFDPFKLVVSASYGARDYNEYGNADVEDRKGWSAELKASYKTAFGTPILGAWYTTGDDADDAFRNGWLPGINPYSSPTATFFDACTSLNAGVDRYTTLGTWGVQLGIEDVSFIQGLTHTATATWIQGTNNTQAVRDNTINLGTDAPSAYAYMSTSDSVVELALTSNYAIYKNLTATLELAYLISDFDNSADMTAARGTYDEDDWRAGLTFTYKF